MLDLDLQLFAESPNDAEPPVETPPVETAQPTYTQEQFDQAKSDWEKDWQSKLDQAVADAKKAGLTEAERLAQMTEAERLQEQLKQLQTENEQYKTAENRRTLEAEAVKALAGEKLPASFAQMVMAENAEGIKTNIVALKETFNSAVQAAVEERIKGGTPKSGSHQSSQETLEAQIDRIMQRGR